MAIKFGEIDATQILENEYRIRVLEGIVDWILANNTAWVEELTPRVMSEIRENAVGRLREKYPKSDVRFRVG